MKKSILDELINDQEKNVTFVSENEVLFPLIEEINLIQTEEIQSFVRSVLLKTNCFWHIPASFSSSYHPPDEHNQGGNVLHTKRVVRIASLLCESYSLVDSERDIVLAAAILHDVTKGVLIDGSDEFSYDPMHPYTVNGFILDCITYDKTYSKDNTSSTLFVSEEDLQTILRLIRCHLGPWSPVPETIPITYMDYILHISDHVASNIHKVILDSNLINPQYKNE